MQLIHSRLQRVIWQVVGYRLCVVALVLTVISVMVDVIVQFRAIGKGHYGALKALWYVILSIPSDVYMLLPIALIAGVCWGIKELVRDNTLAILMTSGMSRVAFVKKLVFGVVWILVVAMVLGEWIGPAAKQYARNMRIYAVSSGQMVGYEYGIWWHYNNHWVYFNRVYRDKHLEGVWNFTVDMHTNTLLQSTYADSLRYQQDHWVANKIKATQYHEDQVTESSASHQPVELPINVEKIRVMSLDVNDTKLWPVIKLRLQNGNIAWFTDGDWLSVYNRMLKPLYLLLALLAAIPIAMVVNSRSQLVGRRSIMAIVAGMGTWLVCNHLGALLLSMSSGLIMAAIVPLVIGVLLCALFRLLFKMG